MTSQDGLTRKDRAATAAKALPVPAEWRAYMDLIAPREDFTQEEIADRMNERGTMNVEQSTISKWRRGTYGPARTFIAASFAEAFGREPLEALVAAGLLDINWVAESLSPGSLATLKKIGIAPKAKRR